MDLTLKVLNRRKWTADWCRYSLVALHMDTQIFAAYRDLSPKCPSPPEWLCPTGWCPRAGSNRSTTCCRPTLSTAWKQTPDWPRALATHGRLPNTNSRSGVCVHLRATRSHCELKRNVRLHGYDRCKRMTAFRKWAGAASALTDHGCPPSQGGSGALVEIICRHHASVRHLESGVHVNTSGHHHPPMSLDDLHPPRNDEVVSDLSGDANQVKFDKASQNSKHHNSPVWFFSF